MVKNTGISSKISDKNNGVIDGRKWTLAELSDSLDQGFTIDDALRLFGKKPSVRKDGKFTIVLYEISTPDSFKNGVRMTLLEMVFEENILSDARIGFASYSN